MQQLCQTDKIQNGGTPQHFHIPFYHCLYHELQVRYFLMQFPLSVILETIVFTRCISRTHQFVLFCGRIHILSQQTLRKINLLFKTSQIYVIWYIKIILIKNRFSCLFKSSQHIYRFPFSVVGFNHEIIISLTSV